MLFLAQCHIPLSEDLGNVYILFICNKKNVKYCFRSNEFHAGIETKSKFMTIMPGHIQEICHFHGRVVRLNLGSPTANLCNTSTILSLAIDRE